MAMLGSSSSKCLQHRQPRSQPRAGSNVSRVVPRTSLVCARAQATDKLQPDWTGHNLLSGFVNVLINTPALWNIMKIFARQAMKNSAESRGIKWDAHVRSMMTNPELQELKLQLEQPGVQYPSYYLKPFHSYEDGNLNWQAAYEVEPASYAMCIRTWKDDKTISPKDAFHKLRIRITDAIKDYCTQHNVAPLNKIVDMGCSTGMSTRWLAQEFPEADIIGMDLSPYFLAVAEYEERRRKGPGKRIKYVHAQAENNGLPAQSQDMLAFQFVAHECPQSALEDFIKEGRRLVKPGGLLVFVDNNPQSKTIQNLPPWLFTLMKSTEPWSDEYYSYDLEAGMRKAGFKNVTTVATDHRHRTVMGIAP